MISNGKNRMLVEVTLESIDLARLVVDLVTDKKGENIVLMDLRDVSLIADFFVIASAGSERQLNAISDHIREEVKKQFQTLPVHIDGRGDSGWVLMDYGDVLIHLFAPELRDYYDLEGLWRDANVLVKVQ
jgi:ribosome-associated protein